VFFAVGLPQIKQVFEWSPKRSMVSSYLAERMESNSMISIPLWLIVFFMMLLCFVWQIYTRFPFPQIFLKKVFQHVDVRQKKTRTFPGL
jgi:hypothetical protein